ncbi:P-loop containing nucleoside triphosphate hydrolase protein [Panus rudis PR-1116 ss-1]|nr:P-loop containing nucleoside triphosphate hydrolase protein [Panus rudis PR-1116 ss-1]
MTVNLNEINEVLLPRRYQEEIFSRAQERNVIAALDTGSGKTYISTLLIKWTAALNAGSGKIIVFLVPKVALVEQQGDFIAKETTLRVSKCYGATAIDLADRRGWRNELENHDVLVMTAQIFLNILTHSHWSMDKVSLMVFDECHHTRKNHAYNGIMREYFQWPAEQRPKVFGMTASPIWNPRDAAESLATLERNLDAKVIAVREHVDELLDHSPKPQEIVHVYPNPPESYLPYHTPILWDRLNLSDLSPELQIPVTKIKTRYEVTYNSLGLYGAELFLYIDVKHRISQIINQAETDIEYLPFQTGSTVMTASAGVLNEKIAPEVQRIERILAEYQRFFEDPENPEVVPIRVQLKWCSPKVQNLADMLFQHYTHEFQGIVFVEQRHVAACLSRMLPRLPQLDGYIRSAQLIGHGASNLAKSQVRGMALKTQQDVVKMFREREVNLLVATSVAEEGLDFPACELVIRFDPIQHMVGYIQSRGRARHKAATFVVMIENGHQTHVDRYQTFQESEPELRRVYQTRDERTVPQVEEDEGGYEDPDDLLERERFVVPSTGAVLTYNTAIGLLNHLCSLIPRDRFTPVQVPQYTGDFEATLQLPSSLPLPPEDLTFVGPPKRSKKEAKRAVAFMAIKRLHSLNVFDDYLLPAKAQSGDNEDSDGRPIGDVSDIPDTMEVMVKDPWTRSRTQYLHIIHVNGAPTAGLVTGSLLPPADLVVSGDHVYSGEGTPVDMDPEDEWRLRRIMEDYTRMGLWWCITGRGISLPLTCYLVPITPHLHIDWSAMEQAVLHPYGSFDWSGVTEEHYGRILVMSCKEFGRPLLLRKIRHDLTPLSTPAHGTRESSSPTYREFFLQKYTRQGIIPEIPEDGPCIEAEPFPRHTTCIYTLDGSYAAPKTNPTFIMIQKMCRWAYMPEEIWRAFHVLPDLCQRITDIYRARMLRFDLGLPPILDDLLIQALTLPGANAGFNNQRLETLGDSVLKLTSVVHLFNRFPHRHEGQLDILRRNSVSNRTLLSRARDIGLECYLTGEPRVIRLWRYTVPEDQAPYCDPPSRAVLRRFPRRSLQDCMEAILGASFVTGGINMALRAGTALGLSLGGSLPWPFRCALPPQSPVSSMFTDLQDLMGYHFRSGHLLLEAVTHPSFKSMDCASYQRLEFLGDAVIDLVVMRYLYNKFPKATSGQLSWARSRAVCSPALAAVAVNCLGLHKLILINNVELSLAISRYVPILEETSPQDILLNGWKQDPPKAISDVLESVIGAVLVDSGYDFEKTCVVAETVLQDLLLSLSPDMPRDPVSALMVWSAQSGCHKISFRKSQSRPELKRNDCVSVIVHDFAVVGPIPAANLSLAKGLAAERARQVLEDPDSPYLLSRICDCKESMGVERIVYGQQLPIDDLEKKLDDETEEGFATLAQLVMSEVVNPEMSLTGDVLGPSTEVEEEDPEGDRESNTVPSRQDGPTAGSDKWDSIEAYSFVAA